jgi:hypothetical protein
VEHLGLPKGKIGAVLAIHTFGDYLNFHPHVHMLVSDGIDELPQEYLLTIVYD